MRIVLFIYRKDSGADFADPDWTETHPLGGTEAAAIHMAAALRRLGHDALATTDPAVLKTRCDVFVSTRFWQLFEKGLRPGRRNYLWCHDDVDQPSVSPLSDPARADAVYRSADGVITLSEYQTKRWRETLHLPPGKVFRSSNGIPWDHFAACSAPLEGRGPLAYYGSTPFRGLNHAIDRWPSVRRRVPGAILHVFSSMRIYGVDDPPEFRALYAKATNTEGIVYHGACGQAEIRQTSRLCRALAYPCNFAETSCITAMEAMASGCVVVSSQLGALPETASGNPLVPLAPDWLDRWEEELVSILSEDTRYLVLARQNLADSPSRDWSRVAAGWVEEFQRSLS